MTLDAGGTFLTKHCAIMAGFPRELTDAVTCCTQPSRVMERGTEINSTQWHDASNISIESRGRSERDAAFEKVLDLIEESPATGKSVSGIINLFEDDLFGTGGTEMEQCVLARHKKRISKLVQKTVMMCSSQDKEFVG